MRLHKPPAHKYLLCRTEIAGLFFIRRSEWSRRTSIPRPNSLCVIVAVLIHIYAFFPFRVRAKFPTKKKNANGPERAAIIISRVKFEDLSGFGWTIKPRGMRRARPPSSP